MNEKSPARISLRAETRELGRLHDWLDGLCQLHQLPPRLAMQLDLCAAELVTNVISYAYAGVKAPEDSIMVQFAKMHDAVTLEIVDWGVEFDATAYAPPGQPANLEEAAIGGRGLLLVRNFAAHWHYRREQGRNQLLLKFAAPQGTL